MNSFISDPEDSKWMGAGAGCALAGLALSAVSGKWHWFAVGACTGAALVGYRLYEKGSRIQQSLVQRSVATENFYGQIGAPYLSPQANVQAADSTGPALLASAADVVGRYPMRNRIPECNAAFYPEETTGPRGFLWDQQRRVVS